MSSTVTQLAGLLGKIRRPGDFYTRGKVELLPPSLSVRGVGPIALPLLPEQAAQLAAAAERAPYGRGPDTIIDTAVRNTLQIGPDRVDIDTGLFGYGADDSLCCALDLGFALHALGQIDDLVQALAVLQVEFCDLCVASAVG